MKKRHMLLLFIGGAALGLAYIGVEYVIDIARIVFGGVRGG